jgi:hypothetical protein
MNTEALPKQPGRPVTILRPIGSEQRTAATVAAIAYLVTLVTLVFATFGIQVRLIVPDNATETARNVLAHEQLFRVGIACYVMYCAGLIVFLTALYEILKPVSPILALLATFWRLIYAVTWVVVIVNLFSGLQLLSGAEYLQVFESGRLQALASLHFGNNSTVFYLGFLFYAMASTICAYLWFKSHYIPRALAAFGVLSSTFCAACVLAFIISPDFATVVNPWLYDPPMDIFEFVTSVWLLFKGLSPVRLSSA